MNHTTLPLLSLLTSHLISCIIHFPHYRVTNIQSSQNTYFTHRILSPSHFRFHSIFITYPHLQITLFFLCTLFLLLFSFPSSTICHIQMHFIHQPYDDHQHAIETNTLFILNYFMASFFLCCVIPIWGNSAAFDFSTSLLNFIHHHL